MGNEQEQVAVRTCKAARLGDGPDKALQQYLSAGRAKSGTMLLSDAGHQHMEALAAETSCSMWPACILGMLIFPRPCRWFQDGDCASAASRVS